MAKGRSDYLLILDVDELLVPRSSHGYRNLPALIADADTNPERTSSFIGSEISHQVRLTQSICVMTYSSSIHLGNERLERRAWVRR